MGETKKYTNHSIEEIEKYLKNIKEQVKKDNFIIPMTDKRPKNKAFIVKYHLSRRKQKEMLLALEATDFCYSADDYTNKTERHYMFSREYELDSWGSIYNVLVYVKIVQKEDNFVVVVSFHEPDKKLVHLFKQKGSV